jgi:trehalose-phosphatase
VTCSRGRRTSSIGWNGGKAWGFSLGRHDTFRGALYDASDAVATDVHERLIGRHVLLLTDYDGTLADIAPTPAEATLSAAVQSELEGLSEFDDVTVGVVSGRRLDDVLDRVGPAAEYAAGLHGLEIIGPESAFHHYALDSVEMVIGSLARDAARELQWCPGVLLENKTYALTCHVRQAPPDLGDRALEEFEALAEPQLEARVLKLLTGAKALELLPAVDWHKGRAAEWIRARVVPRAEAPVSIVYLGDDRTDEDAFTALSDDDVVIGVGDRPHTHLIDWRLAGPPSVGRFFARLAELRRGERLL